MALKYLKNVGDWKFASTLYAELVAMYEDMGFKNPEKRAAGSLGGAVTHKRLRLVIRRNKFAFERIM